ncbi:HEAT repeat domain-containing protein [Speluncibacter jeojiensis]|uniref:HEAT repeat domain-containing protein n=1 Tax=Speluncibacter jeojiensis TaxID=2710754 RepID=A0A9X4RD84_9ACTN|nr:HEAT repeat domain-containing protein [Corynebacteriales bacterium D3-21]
MTTTHHDTAARPARALRGGDPSTRLRAALSAGTDPDRRLIAVLVERCADEPDFFVREMLTWALVRSPASDTVPLLIAQLRADNAQARAQALHTLSKIGDRSAWCHVGALIRDRDDDVARSAWRAAVVLVPDGGEAGLAADLATELGRGDRDVQLSLSRAFVALGEPVLPVLEAAGRSPDPDVRAHAEATVRLHGDPEGAFVLSLELAKRVAATGGDPEEQAC